MVSFHGHYEELVMFLSFHKPKNDIEQNVLVNDQNILGLEEGKGY
jgi:hypothetical protein